MYKREVDINGTPLSFETGKLAKQADGSVLVRMGDSVVLVTACASPNPREGIDFLPLTVDYKEYTYASGRIPGRILQARRQAVGKGSADQPRASIGPFGRCSPPAGATNRRSSRSCFRPTRTTTPTCSPLPARLPRSRSRAFRSRRPSPACAWARWTGKFIINPTYEQRRKSRLDLVIAGSKDGLVMVEAGAKEVSEEDVVQALEAGHAAIKRIVDAIDALAKEAGKKKREAPKKEIDHAFYREVEEKVMIPLGDAMRIQDKLANYGTRRSGAGRPRRVDSRRRSPAEGRSQSASSRS